MTLRLHVASFAILIGLCVPFQAAAQGDSAEIPLGDVARAARKSAALPAHTVIDNDNLSDVMDEVATRRLKGNLLVSPDKGGKTLRISAPDVTCNLSFNSQFSSLLSDPLMPRPLPDSELVKLDGPARIEGNNLQVAIVNNTNWTLREITVSLTLLRVNPSTAREYGSARVVPASSIQADSSVKPSDVTVLYHLAGRATPSSRAIFRSDLNLNLAADQEWHWGIVEAKGTPPPTAEQ